MKNKLYLLFIVFFIIIISIESFEDNNSFNSSIKTSLFDATVSNSIFRYDVYESNIEGIQITMNYLVNHIKIGKSCVKVSLLYKNLDRPEILIECSSNFKGDFDNFISTNNVLNASNEIEIDNKVVGSISLYFSKSRAHLKYFIYLTILFSIFLFIHYRIKFNNTHQRDNEIKKINELHNDIVTSSDKDEATLNLFYHFQKLLPIKKNTVYINIDSNGKTLFYSSSGRVYDLKHGKNTSIILLVSSVFGDIFIQINQSTLLSKEFISKYCDLKKVNGESFIHFKINSTKYIEKISDLWIENFNTQKFNR